MKPPRQIKLKAFTYLFDALQFIKFTFSSSGGKKKTLEERDLYELAILYENISRYQDM